MTASASYSPIVLEGWHPDWIFNGLQLRQSYNGHHVFDISVLIPHSGARKGGKNAQQALSQEALTGILGRKIVLHLRNPGKSDPACRFEGFVDQAEPAWTSRACALRITGYSPTVLMDCMPSFRTFYKKPLSGIARQITEKYGRSIPALSLTGADGDADFSVQYQETDYSYLCRLADEHGKVFFYDGERLQFGSLGQEGQPTKSIRFGKDLKQAGISLNTEPLRFQLGAFDPEKNELLQVSAPACYSVNPLVRETASRSGVYPSSDIHLFTATSGEKDLSGRTSRMQSRQAHNLVRFQGTSDLPGLLIGSRIQIKGAPEILGQGDYTILEISHQINGDLSYSNTFFAVPTGFPFAPRMLSGRAPLCGPLPATVKDHDDPEKLGRVRVEFIGDQEKTRSPWLRVLTPFTGFGGMGFRPEAGDIVLVQSEDFNIEKSAFVSGAFFHGKARADQWHDAENKKKGFATEKISFHIDDRTGKLTIEADEIEIKARKKLKTRGQTAEHSSETNMKIDGGNQLSAQAGRIDLN
ncbi:MAG TPA: contractile injection system protein, VgrG/Pvc8 family [Saprospiraceae bacterium]|nr:contractile injection system protein, VgrG/Pvc8 family [Saprospiraceae bacterium]HPI06223.1 contractile injection system protein, VgrG/Pvc8 family [Saprospiraceae bacterium]